MAGGEDSGGRVLQTLEERRGKRELTEQTFLEKGPRGSSSGWKWKAFVAAAVRVHLVGGRVHGVRTARGSKAACLIWQYTPASLRLKVRVCWVYFAVSFQPVLTPPPLHRLTWASGRAPR